MSKRTEGRAMYDRQRHNRRRFLQESAALLAAGTALGKSQGSAAKAGKPTDDIPIIDTHQHLWDIHQYKLRWLKNAPELARNYTNADYEQATQGLNVIKAIYMEVDVDPSQQTEEADAILQVCKGKTTRTIAAVISGRPDSEGFAAYLDRYRDIKELKGVRQVLHVEETPKGHCLRPEFVRGMRLLRARDLSFDLCMRGKDLSDVPRLLELAHGTRFVLDHCGNPDTLAKDQTAWKADISRIAEKENIVCKVSGILASTKGKPWTADDLAPVVNHVLDAFGPDRVMFGGDWPVCTLGGTYLQWVEALRAIVKNRPLEHQRKLFFENAMAYYDVG